MGNFLQKWKFPSRNWAIKLQKLGVSPVSSLSLLDGAPKTKASPNRVQAPRAQAQQQAIHRDNVLWAEAFFNTLTHPYITTPIHSWHEFVTQQHTLGLPTDMWVQMYCDEGFLQNSPWFVLYWALTASIGTESMMLWMGWTDAWQIYHDLRHDTTQIWDNGFSVLKFVDLNEWFNLGPALILHGESKCLALAPPLRSSQSI